MSVSIGGGSGWSDEWRCLPARPESTRQQRAAVRWRRSRPPFERGVVQVSEFTSRISVGVTTRSCACRANATLENLLHAHYAVPHANAAYLAHQIWRVADVAAPRTVTTLHGTDSRSSVPIRRMHASSRSEREGTRDGIGQPQKETIQTWVCSATSAHSDFLECTEYRRQPAPELKPHLPRAEKDPRMPVSKFSPVKRVGMGSRV